MRYEQSPPLFPFRISDEMINKMICVERRTQKKLSSRLELSPQPSGHQSDALTTELLGTKW